jgi:UDP-glucose 4-epimerase
MKVLLTGAFGNIGRSTLAELVRQGHEVTCFDVPTKANQRSAKEWQGQIRTVWGDMRRAEDVMTAVVGQDAVIHLAFIIPKLSVTGVGAEDRPDFARAVNVGGTRTLIQAMRALPASPKLVFASSVHVYGIGAHAETCRSVSDPLCATDHYSQHKIECEELVRESGLQWAILRLAATFPLALKLDRAMFDVPLSNRMEFVHTKDVGLAMANAVSSDEIWGKILLIGGGPRCHYTYRELVSGILSALGVGALPESAFGSKPFATDWMDTGEGQRILRYQQRTLEDYARDMVKVAGIKRHLIRAFRPLARSWLLARSPYYAPRSARRGHWNRLAGLTWRAWALSSKAQIGR